MLKIISKSIVRGLKWGVVILGTVGVVITIQVYADGHSDKMKSAKAPKTSASGQHHWSPSHGFADLIEQVSPAVVHVAVRGMVKNRQRLPEFDFPPGSPFEDFFDQFRDRQRPDQGHKSRPLGIGSGFIISADGYVVTNNHVVKDADEIVVTLTNGKEYNAELKGTDIKTDLALLKLHNAEDLPYVTWGDDEKSRVGDWVLAIGNPFGLGGSASIGIVSARGRDIRSGPYDDYIQVDAAINRGNSGGPLFNLQGDVIGINTAIFSPNGGSVGIGFSIPSNLAKNIISQLRETGEVKRAWIGVEIQSLSADLAEGFGLENDQGALVAKVTRGQPADNAGIRAGDIILSFNGQAIEEMRDLPKLVAQSTVGKKYKVIVWRDGARKTLTIKPERYPDDRALAALGGGSSPGNGEPEGNNSLGARLSELSDELRVRFHLDNDLKGVVVVSVRADGLMDKNGIQTGDVITSVNNDKVDTPADVIESIANAKSNNRSKVVVLLQRNGNSRFIPFDLDEE